MIGQKKRSKLFAHRMNIKSISLMRATEKYIKGDAHRRCSFLYVIQTNINKIIKTKFAGQSRKRCK